MRPTPSCRRRALRALRALCMLGMLGALGAPAAGRRVPLSLLPPLPPNAAPLLCTLCPQLRAEAWANLPNSDPGRQHPNWPQPRGPRVKDAAAFAEIVRPTSFLFPVWPFLCPVRPSYGACINVTWHCGGGGGAVPEERRRAGGGGGAYCPSWRRDQQGSMSACRGTL